MQDYEKLQKQGGLDMKINRIDHVGVIVHDLSAAKDFFLDIGLEVLGEAEVEGEWAERIIGLNDVRETIVMLGMPNGEATLELIKFHSPSVEKGIQQPTIHTHIAFAVEDIEEIVAKLKKRGTEIFGEIQNYENTYKLCYARGPEGIMIEFAEKIK
jgi:catechol 2,3-dioxygenase-like lactoylglutathione lyase family enzyme